MKIFCALAAFAQAIDDNTATNLIYSELNRFPTRDNLFDSFSHEFDRLIRRLCLDAIPTTPTTRLASRTSVAPSPRDTTSPSLAPTLPTGRTSAESLTGSQM